MNNEKQRLVLIVLLMFGWMLLINYLGFGPKPVKKAPPVNQAKAAQPDAQNSPPGAEKPKDGPQLVQGQTEPGTASSPKAEGEPPASRVEVVPAAELVMGSLSDRSPGGYHLEIQLDQNGAGIESALSSRYDAEFEGRKNPHQPLQLIRRNVTQPPSMSLTLQKEKATAAIAGGPAEAPATDGTQTVEAFAGDSEELLDSTLWEVVRDADGKAVHPIRVKDPQTDAPIEGQEVVFRVKAALGVIVTKTYRLRPAADGVEVSLTFDSPDKERSLVYKLMGPHGIPIEGEWYTGTFREVFFGTYDGSNKIDTHTSYDIAKGKTIDTTALPLRFAGVENQYFALFMAPFPAPSGHEDRIDLKTEAVLLEKDPNALQKSDVGVRMTSRPIKVGPNVSVMHTYRVFLGPKTPEALAGETVVASLSSFRGPSTPEALAAYDATGLSAYRKSSIIPGASSVARYVITPILGSTYRLTEWVAQLFGGKVGNWGIAIILMTLLVKLVMFPLGRKQALMAQKTQELQPLLKEIQEKYKDEKDKEKQTRETLALYKKHGVNPVSGCIPALIQLPIFVGLWQALNSSVALRQAPFLWISDLAAPDMLFRFPVEVPFLGHWFNLLPILVVVLMLFQTKLFSPPATTPEAEMQQKTMKFMMIFMAAMFYKVPSGLGIYFITSSLWSIGERLLLPKMSHAAHVGNEEDEENTGGTGRGLKGILSSRNSAAGNGSNTPKKPPSALSQFWEKVLEDARKNPTYRKMLEDREEKEPRSNSEDRRERDRGKPRARPGRK